MLVGAAALACGEPAVEVVVPPGPAVASAGPGEVAAAVPEPAAPPGCAELAATAATSPEDAALLVWTCPEVKAGPAVLRGALLQAGSPAEAAALLPRLAGAPDLAGLARLAALDRAAALPGELPDPVTAPVSPVTEAVIAGAVRAIGAHTASGLNHEQRTRAMAYLARTYHEALAQLGLPQGQPLPPFARLLAGRFLHFGRSFCQMYWQRRVAGLEGLFAATEGQLMRVMLALEATPHTADDALLAVERQRARRYLQGGGVAERLKSKGVTESPAELLPIVNEFDRLVDHGFVELAIQRALFLAGEQPVGFGVAPVAEVLVELLSERDLGEFRALLDRRIAEARALQPPPPEHGAKALPPRRKFGWTDAAEVAGAARRWLAEAQQASGFARRHALARAILLLRDRPDATRSLLREILPSKGPGIALGIELLESVDGDSLAWLRLRAAASGATSDVAIRRTFALASRDAGLLPR
jgi:hypothetical protein